MKTCLSHVDFPGAGLRVCRVDFDAATLQADDMLILPHHLRLANAVAKRRAEHLAGRMAASLALGLHGIRDYVPGIGLHRAPCWPPGFTGSITHTDSLALATVIPERSGEPCGVGIDAEVIMNAYDAREIACGIVTPAERQRLLAGAFPFPLALTLVFSAKESLFKALYRHVGRYFDFSAAEVININDLDVELMLTSPLGPFRAGQVFYAFWQRDGRQLTTLIRCGSA